MFDARFIRTLALCAVMSCTIASAQPAPITAQGLTATDQQRLAEANVALTKYKDCSGALSALKDVSARGRQTAAWMKSSAAAEICIGTLEALRQARSLYERILAKTPDRSARASLADVNYRIRKIQQGGSVPDTNPTATPNVAVEVPLPIPVATVRPGPQCDTGRGSNPRDPEGYWTDGGPFAITNKCECVDLGIRVVGVRFGAFNGLIPAIYMQVFNTSGERRSIWADVKFQNSGWEQSRPFTLRGDERAGYQTLKERRNGDRITDINVLGCGR